MIGLALAVAVSIAYLKLSIDRPVGEGKSIFTLGNVLMTIIVSGIAVIGVVVLMTVAMGG